MFSKKEAGSPYAGGIDPPPDPTLSPTPAAHRLLLLLLKVAESETQPHPLKVNFRKSHDEGEPAAANKVP